MCFFFSFLTYRPFPYPLCISFCIIMKSSVLEYFKSSKLQTHYPQETPVKYRSFLICASNYIFLWVSFYLLMFIHICVQVYLEDSKHKLELLRTQPHQKQPQLITVYSNIYKLLYRKIIIYKHIVQAVQFYQNSHHSFHITEIILYCSPVQKCDLPVDS